MLKHSLERTRYSPADQIYLVELTEREMDFLSSLLRPLMEIFLLLATDLSIYPLFLNGARPPKNSFSPEMAIKATF